MGVSSMQSLLHLAFALANIWEDFEKKECSTIFSQQIFVDIF